MEWVYNEIYQRANIFAKDVCPLRHCSPGKNFQIPYKLRWLSLVQQSSTKAFELSVMPTAPPPWHYFVHVLGQWGLQRKLALFFCTVKWPDLNFL